MVAPAGSPDLGRDHKPAHAQVGVFGPGNMHVLAPSVGRGFLPRGHRDQQLAIQDAHWLGLANDGFGVHHPIKPRSSALPDIPNP